MVVGRPSLPAGALPEKKKKSPRFEPHGDTRVKVTALVPKNSLIDDTFQAGCDESLINAASSKTFQRTGGCGLPHMAYFAACRLCNFFFPGAFTIYRVKKPLEMSQSFFCVSACIWADLWVLLSPQPAHVIFTARMTAAGTFYYYIAASSILLVP